MTRKKAAAVEIESDWPADRVERRPINDLLPYAGNPRAHPDWQIAQISESMKTWGWTIPILIDENGVVIAGHGRIFAALRNGYAEVPCMIAKGWSDEKKRAYVIADNKLALNSDWDIGLLTAELSQLDDTWKGLTGFDPSELKSLFGSSVEPPDGFKTFGDDIEVELHLTAPRNDVELPKFNLDTEPCPTIMAGGIHACWRDQYHLTEDGRTMAAAATDKPPFRIPSMAEINAIPWNGKTVVSTFSGAGGSCLGYRMAGFRVAWANEFAPEPQQSYKANAIESSILSELDIRSVQATDILKAIGLRPGELDVFDGSPPCQAFSTAGSRERGWGKDKTYAHGAKQKNETLFDEYIRLLRELQPKVFIAENVSGLVKGTAKGFFLEILKGLKSCGYTVEAQLLDAQWLGVPQARQRIIFMGVRNDLNRKPAFPIPLKYRYSVRDALPHIGGGELRLGAHGFQKEKLRNLSTEPCSTVAATGLGSYKYGIEEVRPLPPSRKPGSYGVSEIDPSKPSPTVTCASPGNDLAVPMGSPPPYNRVPGVFGTVRQIDPELLAQSVTTVPLDLMVPVVVHDTSSTFARNVPITDKPCPAITNGANEMNSSHYLVAGEGEGDTKTTRQVDGITRRKFTIAELKAICSFPDDFELKGSYAQQWMQLGNSVPPVMMSHIAAAIRDKVLA